VWLGPLRPDELIWNLVGARDATAGRLLELGWAALRDDSLPVDVIVSQLPERMVAGDKHYQFSFRPVPEVGQLESMVVVLSDVTSTVERERIEAAHSELVTILGRVANDRAGFLEFVGEATTLVEQVVAADKEDPAEVMRILHTLKGNSALIGVKSFADRCQHLEDLVLETRAPPTSADRAELEAAWREVRSRLSMFLGGAETKVVSLGVDEYGAFRSALANGAPRAELAAMVESWAYEPALCKLERLAEQARALAERLDKSGLEVTIEDNGVRLPPARHARFWSVFVHVVRNAVDHGIEPPDERIALGKPPEGRITLRTAIAADDVVIELRDDGRGIDWEAIATKARERGLPAACRANLEDALFSDGISTRSGVTEISGRGVGLAAVRQVCRELGATIQVESTRGVGTLVRFRVPREGSPEPRTACRAEAAPASRR
jgi:two-component system chemotaxis sensor kinase CheA